MPDPDHAPDLDATIRVAAPNPATGARQEPDIPQPEELAALLPGENYTVESFLGAGGMGAVYRGTQVRLQRKVAIKIMRRDRAKDQGFEERFRREALAMAQLNHPNIVNVIDYGEAGADYLYIVMEFIDGTDLVSVIRSGEMTQETALKLLPQICDALQFAHDHGIVHRDIKPANILLTRDGRIKMADFGLAKRFDAENSYRTQSGYGMGTPDYAAPEQFMGDANVDHRADIYALGVMIYQMVTGTLPRGAWKPPSEKAAVDAFWDHIVARALQTDPHDRYASVSEIKTDLGGITPTTGAPRLAADGTQARKTAGMTAAKGSTTALTQAGGRPVTKIKSSASQDDVQPGTSSRNRVLMLAAAALVVVAGVYLAWEKLKPAPSGVMTTLPAAGKASYPQPKVWVDATQEVRNAAVKAEAGTVQGDWLQFSKGHALPLPGGKILRDAVVRMTFKGLVCIEMRKTPEGMHYQGEAVPGQIAGFHIRNEKSNPRKLAMKAARFVPGFDAMAEHELVMFTHGDLIEVWVDGLPMLSERDSKLTQGSISLAFVHHQNFPVPYPSLKKVEYGELTGAPVAAAAASLPASFSMWQVPLPTVTPDTEWTNLIPHIQPERDAFRGGWTVDDKGLQVKRAEWAYCSIPVQDPGTDYDLRYKVTRGEGSHLAMFFAFRKGNTGGYVPIDYIYDKNPAFADGLRWATIEDITNLDMTHPDAVKTKRKEWLPRGKTCTVLLQVREREVIVSVDDEEAFRWPADWSRIQQREGGGAPLFSEVIGDPHFGVGVFNCDATFHSIEMRKVSSPATKSDPLPAISFGTEWTDIVPHIQPERDAVRGDWESGKDGLACVNLVRWSLLKFPVQPPADDYEVRYKLTRTSGPVDGLFFPFLHGNAAGSFAVDYPGHVSFDGMRRVALQEVKGRATLEKPSEIMAVRKEWIPFGKTCTVLLQVSAKEVRVLVDDVEAIRWQADWSQIQQSSGGYPWAPVFQGLKKPIFGIGMFNSAVIYHSIEMRKVPPPETKSAPLPAIAIGTEWTHIVPHIKPERDAMRGEWTVDGGSLSIQRAPWAVCRLPVQDPGTDYDLRYRITRGEGDHRAMFFFFEKGNTGAFVAMDYINPALPEFADGQRWLRMEGNPENLKAKRKEWLPRGKECTVLLQVRDKEVIVFLDDEEVFRTPADWSRLSQGGGIGKMRFADLTGETIFGVGVYDCHATFHSIEMRRVGEPKASASASSPASATKDAPFVNSLGMKFVPVPITGGPTDGKHVLFSVWETRVQDYEAFAKDSNRPWMKPGFPQDHDHAAVNMTWDDATAFCAWLTEHEHKKGKLDASARYRMPSDHEWSCAVGISHLEDAARTPGQKDRALAGQFPWGTAWPPPVSAGNYAGEEMVPAKVPGRHESASPCMGFRDAFVETSPAGSFPANALGLHELGGNVWEWCEDWYDATQKERVLRGGGFIAGDQSRLLSSTRNPYRPTAPRSIYFGFRCVLEPP